MFIEQDFAWQIKYSTNTHTKALHFYVPSVVRKLGILPVHPCTKTDMSIHSSIHKSLSCTHKYIHSLHLTKVAEFVQSYVLFQTSWKDELSDI